MVQHIIVRRTHFGTIRGISVNTPVALRLYGDAFKKKKKMSFDEI